MVRSDSTPLADDYEMPPVTAADYLCLSPSLLKFRFIAGLRGLPRIVLATGRVWDCCPVLNINSWQFRLALS
jgi:hypothetical protein